MSKTALSCLNRARSRPEAASTACGLVVATRGQQFAIGAEPDHPDVVLLRFALPYEFAALCVPDGNALGSTRRDARAVPG